MRHYRSALGEWTDRRRDDASRHRRPSTIGDRTAGGTGSPPTAASGWGTPGCRSSTCTTGAQPIANEDESALDRGQRRVLRLRADPRASCATAGHRFRTGSDSEIALHLYEDLGPECLHHLRGEFAFVIWDGRNRRLFAGRDRFGVKPLFYAEHGGALYLASEVKALFAMGVPARWSAEAVYAGGVHPAGRAHPLPRRPRRAARALSPRHAGKLPAAPVLGCRLPGGREHAGSAHRRRGIRRRDSARCSRSRSRPGCGPMSPWAAT